ncbi:30S ribosomal protein S4e [Candidatus Woesearchaeota archaeon]|nr:30S ribosomal protein S4e [Candidatus Woesearchaeota archaeon]RLE40875.1 MAG: 30S ribosomal protein S4e [Candidatus Woesearchaeota archaeon]
MGSIGEKHVKRLAAPRTWPIARRKHIWIIKPLAGKHPLDRGLPLLVILRDLLGYAKTRHEAKKIVNAGEVLVDGVKAKDLKMIVGLMDVLEFPKLNEAYRVVINPKGKLHLIRIDAGEKNKKLCKVVGKKKVKSGKMQLNGFDGRNFLYDGDVKVGDSLLIELPSQKVLEHFKLEKGVVVYLTGGKHIGMLGKVEGVDKEIKLVVGDEVIETDKQFVFVVGKEKPAITLS